MATAKKPTAAELAARYGYAITFFNSNPELKALLANAQTHNWDVANFQAAIRNTTWWKSRSDSQRTYDIALKTDPGNLNAQITRRRDELKAQAAATGVKLSWAELTQLTKDTIRNGSNDAEVRAQLAAKWLSNWNTAVDSGTATQASQTGGVATTMAQLKQTAAAYGYPLGDDRLALQTMNVLAGNAQPQDIAAQYKEWAKVHFKSVAAQLDAGQTVADVLDPYKQIAAQELGMDKDQMRVDDPQWTAAIAGPEPLTLADWRTKIRTDASYGWDRSANAQQQAYQMVAGLQQMFQGG
jgi:hypothetical protein